MKFSRVDLFRPSCRSFLVSALYCRGMRSSCREFPFRPNALSYGFGRPPASQLIDVRNRPVYRKDTGGLQFWYELGPSPDHLTRQASPGEYYVWLNDDWPLPTWAAATEQAKPLKPESSETIVYVRWLFASHRPLPLMNWVRPPMFNWPLVRLETLYAQVDEH